jgi:CheY-like chemotaxis protein
VFGLGRRFGGLVIGSVALWGQVIEHDYGYRAEHAYPDRIRLACVPCLRAGGEGRAEVVLGRSCDALGGLQLAPACSEHAHEVSPVALAVSARAVQTELLSTYAVDLLPPVVMPSAGRLVIADRHRHVRQGLKRYMSLAGFEVLGEAEDGTEALRLVEELHPDVVTTCIRMPVMDGLELTRLIRRRLPEVEVVILTAYPDEVFKREAKASGAAAYLVKSEASAEDLTRVLRSVVAIARAPRGGG